MRGRDERADADALAAYWSGLVAGLPDEDLAELAARLEPDVVALLARLRARRRYRPREATFLRRLEAQTLATYLETMRDPTLREPLPLDRGTRFGGPLARLYGLVRAWLRRWGGWLVAVLFALFVGYLGLTFFDGRYHPTVFAPSVAPAIVDTPGPAGSPSATAAVSEANGTDSSSSEVAWRADRRDP